ncbi:hypothetical protein EUX98_g5824 [Antrodiella citrinella]|uniref:G-patch domain-containing protein n=1 Tax=Antrodiella citrinella TaxID=2447956 RepID=A0A4S4MQJ8_9APHY|nr:hypothetical protein EUX98_g5824 [Antrodiella citrinella]
MTGRLKRKLQDIGVDTSSSKANENFCLIGTPLPPLEKLKDKGEFVPLWKQDVRDEKGRRRLHGAFTGGFSAGYYNSVGSKEGWTPQTFVSSRADRAKKQAARPEDFMDEEDMAELAESRKLVDETEEMDLGSTAAELKKRQGEVGEDEDDSISAALGPLMEPSPLDSAGGRILKKMGWRVGQGIGPRLTYEQRREQDIALGYSPMELDDEEAKKHKYPRRDTPLLLVSRKDNSHGLGYKPGMGLNESLGVQDGAGVKGPQLASGFGLGALNDADEDDLDVYDSSIKPRRRNHLAYEDEDDGTRITLGSSSKRAVKNQGAAKADIAVSHFSDGRPVLQGFVAAAKPIMEDKWFPLPDVPAGWTPNPRRVWDADNNKENNTADWRDQPKSHAEWKSGQLSADQRGSILGETPLPAQQRSVFDYMSQKDRERLQNLKAPPQASPDEPVREESPSPGPKPLQIQIPHMHPSVAKAALTGFQPFTSDPVKQSRYTAFLNYASQDQDSSSSHASAGIGPTPGQSIEEFNKEIADYAKSATVFKPLSGAMAGRFRSAIIVENGPKIIEGLHQPDPDAKRQEEEEAESKKDEDPRMSAVKLGMYGRLTREVQPWQPAKLLCKRFGVKEPEVEQPSASADEAPPPPDAQQEMAKEVLAIMAGTSASEPGSSKSRDLANIGLGDDETQGQDTLTYVRPSMDVFKAIFASDDEDDDDDDDIADAPESAELPVPGLSAAPQLIEPKAELQEASVNNITPSTSTLSEKVDISTFKPTFVPRADRKDKTGAIKDKKKKPSKPAVVSFDDDEEGLQVSINAPKKNREKRKHKDHDGDRKKKKKKKKDEEVRKEDGPGEDDMWVEAPPPEVVQTLSATIAVPMDTSEDVPPGGNPVGPPRGRKRAVDFM